jgi:hypothetical protein
MVKPADAQSSRGITRLAAQSSPADIAAAFDNALAQTTQDFVVAEQFIVGTEITVEGIKTPKGHHTLAISAKKHFRTGIASELRYPAPLGTDFTITSLSAVDWIMASPTLNILWQTNSFTWWKWPVAVAEPSSLPTLCPM